MKKLLGLIMALVLALALSGCGTNPDPKLPPDATATPSGGALSLPTPPVSALDDLTDPGAPDDSDDPVNPDDAAGLTPDEDEDADPDAQGTDLSGQMDEGNADPLTDDDATPTVPVAAKLNPTPVSAVAIKDYVLADYEDQTLGLSLKYPSHWTVESGVNTLTFVEPVESDKVAMRLALTVKSYDEKLTAAQQKKEFASYNTAIKQGYDKFKKGKNSNQLSFMNRPSLSCNYNAMAGGKKIRGFIVMANNTKTKQIVALHFSTPQAKFKNSEKFFKKILYSVTPIETAATPAPSPAPTT